MKRFVLTAQTSSISTTTGLRLFVTSSITMPFRKMITRFSSRTCRSSTVDRRARPSMKRCNQRCRICLDSRLMSWSGSISWLRKRKDFVQEITYATNSQNPVDLHDLRSNDEIQKTLELGMKDLRYTYKRQREEGGGGSSVITSAIVAEATLAVWREKPHQAKFRRKEHFGKLYVDIFTELNAAQAILAVLIFRDAENERKRPSEAGPPPFIPYSAHYIAMLIGRELLQEQGVKLAAVSHRYFAELVDRLRQDGGTYHTRAVAKVSDALKQMLRGSGNLFAAAVGDVPSGRPPGDVEHMNHVGFRGGTDADHHYRAGAVRHASHIAHTVGQRRKDGRAAERLGRSAAAGGDVPGVPSSGSATPATASSAITSRTTDDARPARTRRHRRRRDGR